MLREEDYIKRYLTKLNKKQLEAVKTIEGPVLLLAVPGSGKTTVLVNRLGYMIYCKGIEPENILTLTYTVVATEDMRRRFENIFGNELNQGLEFRTINGICSKIINLYGRLIGKKPFELLTDSKLVLKIFTEILAENMEEYPTESDVKGAITLITYCKNMLLEGDEIDKIGNEAGLPLLKIYKTYNDYLKNNSLMDYDDQLIYAYRMLKDERILKFFREKYKYICVDEAQDTSKIQHMIINLLSGENGNLFMVGDEDQSIYGFRAAYPEALLNFEKIHPNAKVLLMDTNYRSNGKIVTAADAFIQKNKDRHKKHMVPDKNDGDDICFVELNKRQEQYDFLIKVAANSTKESAVLYRDNESAIPLIDMLLRSGLPFRLKGSDMTFFTNRVVLDVVNIFEFALNPYNTELFMKIYYKCKTYLKKNQALFLCKISEERKIPVLDGLKYIEDVSQATEKKCIEIKNNLKNLLSDKPTGALYRIENTMGYGEYLDRNQIETSKLFILKMLAMKERDLRGFLSRLEYLREQIADMKPDMDSKFILSTIHSSKGLEYDRVYMLDVCDGVFPARTIAENNIKKSADRGVYEEERRLFYVGITRAKSELCLFKIKDEKSCFLKEIAINKAYQRNKGKNDKDFDCNLEMVIGQKVNQKNYGPGVIIDVFFNEMGKQEKFTVSFENGEEKKFAYPAAFKCGMKLV